ncbi:MAG: hypothetical protein HZB67_02690 [Candidatus Aenigmarchaeota archaeon]|nr:hypothetical protein [Candidatus Aenigmarchaeota archaeon]
MVCPYVEECAQESMFGPTDFRGGTNLDFKYTVCLGEGHERCRRYQTGCEDDTITPGLSEEPKPEEYER